MPAAPKPIRVPASSKVGYDRCNETTETWLTPPALLKALGPFDLDPATPEQGMLWRTARKMLKPSDDGLAMAWPKKSFVWLNPPYGRGMDAWLSKAAEHGNGVALIFARMETSCMHASVLTHPNASAVVFTRGRLSFCREDGTPGKACPMGSIFVAYGAKASKRLYRAVSTGQIRGHYLNLATVRCFSTRSAKPKTLSSAIRSFSQSIDEQSNEARSDGVRGPLKGARMTTPIRHPSDDDPSPRYAASIAARAERLLR